MNLRLLICTHSRDYLPNKIKDGAYVTNLDEYSDIGTHWTAFYVQNNVTYFASFEVEYIPKEINTFVGTKNIKTNIFRVQAYDSIICGYFCIGFIDFMLTEKTLTDFINLFSVKNFKKKWWYNFKPFYDKSLKIAECNSVGHGVHETLNMYPNLKAVWLSDQQQFTLNKINEIKYYFVAEIIERELMSKSLSKYNASFD